MRRQVLFSLMAAIVTIAPAAAQQPQAETPGVYIVRPGDTLWGIAGRYLADPYRWPELFSLNRAVVADPHWIYPNERLRLPGGDGLSAQDASAGASAAELSSGRTIFHTGGGADPDAGRTLRLAAEAAAPVVTAGTYYRAGFLRPETEVRAIGEIVDIVGPTAVPRQRAPQIQPYDRVYLRLTGEVAAGERLHLMRRDRAVPPYGRIFTATGTGVVLAVESGVATVEVDGFYDRVQIGDLALPMPAFDPRAGIVPMADGGLDGVLLAFAEVQPLLATEDLAFVNLGTASGVAEGDEFVAYLPASSEAWGVRPEERVARLQVVRAGVVTSTVRVLAMENPALAPGMPVRLVARMP